MSAYTAMFTNMKLTRRLSESSPFVAASKASPHYQKIMSGLSDISSRSNQLTDEEMDILEQKKRELYQRQVISYATKEGDLEFVNKDTVLMTSILSRYRNTYLSGGLSVTTPFSEPAIEILEDAVYGGTTGIRRKENGERDHTAKRTYVASDNETLQELGNLSHDDKRRVMKGVELLNQSEEEDPWAAWSENQIKIAQANKAREQVRKVDNIDSNPSSTPISSDSLDWNHLI